MKKLLTLTLLLSSLALPGLTQASESKRTDTALNSPQIRIQIGRRLHDRDWNRRYGDRVRYGRTFTRDVRYGRRVYRETYQIRDGRTYLISRFRVY